jgi:hypothetical protein
MKVAVIGSRTFDDLDKLSLTMLELPFEVTIVISGGAKGADALAEKSANENNIPIRIHKPDWTKYGKGAGVIRNRLIIDDCDYCLAFWDGASKGTKSSIDYCKSIGKGLKIIFI